MKKNSLVIAATVTAVGLLAAGCGGGEDGLSKDEFVAKADAICKEANANAMAIDVKGPDDPEFHGRFQAAVRKLSALTPVEEEKAAVDEVISAFERAGSSTELPEGVQAIFNAWAKAESYGLKECTKLGHFPPIP